MRKIYFRGKDLDGNWREGDLIWATLGYGQKPMILDAFDEIDIGNNLYEVAPETVGQFTGLCDCRGQDIYEGDIVAFGDFFREHDVENEYWHGVVKWSFESARFVLDKLEFDEDVCNDELLVIGNVYDNPELLEAKNA